MCHIWHIEYTAMCHIRHIWRRGVKFQFGVVRLRKNYVTLESEPINNHLSLFSSHISSNFPEFISHPPMVKRFPEGSPIVENSEIHLKCLNKTHFSLSTLDEYSCLKYSNHFPSVPQLLLLHHFLRLRWADFCRDPIVRTSALYSYRKVFLLSSRRITDISSHF